MTEDPTSAPDGPQAANYAFIGAVHRLLDSDRATSKSDLLLAAACQALREGDLSVAEVQERVNAIWPGARADRSAIESALKLGKEIRLTATGATLDGGELWTLTKEGVEDATRHERWLDDIRQRATRDVMERARTGLQIDVTTQEAELWLDRLLTALVKGIQLSQAAYLGQVEKIVDGRLLPKSIDHELVLAALPQSSGDEEVGEFVRSLALAAIDPLDPFGNDLISHITTGCVLHSYIAGRDTAAILDRIGTAHEERAILDTPVLLELVGPARMQSRVEATIRVAQQQGWDVVAAEHSIDELVDLLERDIPKVQRSFTRAKEAGTRAEWYAALDQDQLPSLCVEVLQDGTYPTLDAMIFAARDLPSRLFDLGVTVRPSGNAGDEAYVDRCRSALQKQIDEHSSRPRSPLVVERDANSMAMAWRRRRRQKASKWPGAWIITSDRHITPAYLAAQKDDRISLTLSLAQWTSLLTVSAQPTTVVELARVAAQQLIDEAMWLIPARFPADVALDLARQLSPSQGGSETDMRLAQLTLEDAFGDDEAASSTSMAAEVLSKRTRRNNALAEQRKRDLEKFADVQQQKSRLALTDAQRAREGEKTAEEKVSYLQSETQEQSAELDWLRTQRKRILLSAIPLIIGIAVLVWSVVTGHAGATWASGIGTTVTLLAALRWCTERDSKWYFIVVGAILEAVGLLANLKSLLPG